MKMYIGTYSDETIIRKLKEETHNDVIDHNKTMPYASKKIFIPDEEIKSKLIDAGRISWALTEFYAHDHNDAIRQARQMGLKNFSPISNKMYEQGIDF